MRLAPSVRRATFAAFVLGIGIAGASASSHREAPGITRMPKVDATDFYMFRSYEAGREGFVTFVADYLPLQDPYGGPNYFTLDSDALYDIRIDNDGDAVEDLTFRFRFQSRDRGTALTIGPAGATRSVPIPLILSGPFGAGDTAALNRDETYTVELLRGAGRRTGQPPKGARSGDAVFVKPTDNIGQKSIADYDRYAAESMYDVTIPGCGNGRLFAGQRKDPFVVNLGETFDLVNLNPLGPVDGEADSLCDKNVTALVLEVPIECVVRSASQPVVGAWTAASLPMEKVSDRTAASFLFDGARY